MLFVLLAALLLPDLWIVADRPSNDDLDVILTCVMGVFLVEFVVQVIGLAQSYCNSFFFWMDILGACSVLLDLSYITRMWTSSSTLVSQNTVVMRAARVAKLGARAGRFTKLLKLLRFLPGMRDTGLDQNTARVLSAKLNFVLSVRVSCLIIVLVLVMPLFSAWTYPEQDWSVKTFMGVLDKAALERPARFAWQLAEFTVFYEDKEHYPFYLDLRPGAVVAPEVSALLPWIAPDKKPVREANIARYESSVLLCAFSLQRPNQSDALLNMVLLLAVMILMVGFALVLSTSVSTIVLVPLERLLVQVRRMAAMIFQSVTELRPADEDSESDVDGKDSRRVGRLSSNVHSFGHSFGEEVSLLERVGRKLEAATSINVNRTQAASTDDMRGLGSIDRAVIHGFEASPSRGAAPKKRRKDIAPAELQQESLLEGESCTSSSEDESEEDGSTNVRHLRELAMLEHTGLSTELIDSWNLNPLELDRARNQAVVMYCLGSQNHGVTTSAATMGNFLMSAEAGYTKSLPYHNWYHAIDATHCVHRLLKLCKAEVYLDNLERFGLLVSAVCHDLGHPGLNNSFLIEASHEIALRYNDRSPLEHMHCARLFELVSAPKCNIFAQLPRTQFREIRGVCIEAILHTDNAKHFAMIRDVEMLREVNSELLAEASDRFAEDHFDFPIAEIAECFKQTDVRALLVKLLLHLADLSNGAKPFRVCRVWAQQALEEFFAQGEEERKLGMPVQALNDRLKVNRSLVQVGFLEFVASPLFFATARVLPPTEPLVAQLVQNVGIWHQQWLEGPPVPENGERMAMAQRVGRLQTTLDELMGC